MGNRFRRQGVALITLLPAVLLATACGERRTTDGDAPPVSVAEPEENGGGETIADPCAWLASRRFRSAQTFPGGLGPDGPVEDHQQLEFAGGKYSWMREDFSNSGTYRCADGVVSAWDLGESIEAHVDAARRILVWNGIEFEPVD